MAVPKAGKQEDPKIADLMSQARLLEAQVAVAELRARFHEANVRIRKATAEFAKLAADDQG
jgi:hypothetical protein